MDWNLGQWPRCSEVQPSNPTEAAHHRNLSGRTTKHQKMRDPVNGGGWNWQVSKMKSLGGSIWKHLEEGPAVHCIRNQLGPVSPTSETKSHRNDDKGWHKNHQNTPKHKATWKPFGCTEGKVLSWFLIELLNLSLVAGRMTDLIGQVLALGNLQ